MSEIKVIAKRHDMSPLEKTIHILVVEDDPANKFGLTADIIRLEELAVPVPSAGQLLLRTLYPSLELGGTLRSLQQ